jgi:hypothetical protein
MLHEFLSSNRRELMWRTSPKGSQARDLTTPDETPESGVPLFLTQLAETLRLERTAMPFSPTAIGEGAASHSRELLANGFTVARVVHDYGSACQAITELAVEKKATITPAEFHTLACCLHTAIAEAVTEYGRLKEEAADRREHDRRAQLAHDLRNFVQAAQLSFQVLQAGKAAPSGSAGKVLGRSLVSIRDLTDGILSDLLGATTPRSHDDAGAGLVEARVTASR